MNEAIIKQSDTRAVLVTETAEDRERRATEQQLTMARAVHDGLQLALFGAPKEGERS